MKEVDPYPILGDPLSQLTRLERRNLLIASSAALLIGHVGLIPARIGALGIEINTTSQQTFLLLLALVVIYRLIAFAIYAAADYFVWNKLHYDFLLASIEEEQNWTHADQEHQDEINQVLPPIYWYWQKAPCVSKIRITFELVLPLCIGTYTVAMLVIIMW